MNTVIFILMVLSSQLAMAETTINANTVPAMLTTVPSGPRDFSISLRANRFNQRLIGLMRRDGLLCGASYRSESWLTATSYVAPVTACLMAKTIEDWNSKCAKNGESCRLQFGEMLPDVRAEIVGPMVAEDGDCFYVYPQMSSAKGDGQSFSTSQSYDRNKTQQLLEVFFNNGATQFTLGDQQLALSLNEVGVERLYIKGHFKQMTHVCIKDTPRTRDICQSYEPDLTSCPEFETLFKNPEMVKIRQPRQR